MPVEDCESVLPEQCGRVSPFRNLWRRAYGDNNDSLRGDDIIGVALADFASAPAGPAATWTVVNTSAIPADLYWIDETGSLVFYETVPAGGTFVQPTFAGHNWAIIESGTSNILDIVEAPGTWTTTIDATFNDTISGGSGTDQIYGDLGNDLIYAGNKNDSFYAGVGDDTVLGGLGDDCIELGNGNDSFGNFNDAGGRDSI